MKKNILIFLVLLSLSCFGQTKSKTSANNYLNYTIWSQVFNNFDINVPVWIVTPWIVAYGNINHIDNDVFFKNNLKEDKLFSDKNIILKEFSATLNNNFFKYIPVDSTMIVRSLYKNRLLYTLLLKQTDSLITIDYRLPDTKTGENIVFDKDDNLVSNTRFDQDNTTEIKNIKQKESLYYCTIDNSTKSYITAEESQYAHGLLLSKMIFRDNKETYKRKFVSGKKYLYTDDGKLMTILNIDKKGRTIDSINYYYVDNALFSIIQGNVNNENDMIFYQYNNGQLTGKDIKGLNKSLHINRKYDLNKMSLISFIDNNQDAVDQFELGYNTLGQLNSVLCKSAKKSDNIDDNFTNQYVFNYNEMSNVKSIKMIDKKGIIQKEISFEYDYR
ncbi:MAG: hypothetical protein PHT07_08065 [Paludibacter sp.]|nr:hypothetical protein [Paludibacter sp.]